MLLYGCNIEGRFIMKNAETKIREIHCALKTLGVAPHLKGFDVLAYIFTTFSREDIAKCKMMGKNGLYSVVAQVFNSTPMKIEKNIRNAIEFSMDTLVPELLREIFGNTLRYDKDKPCNSLYIATVLDILEYEPEKLTKPRKGDKTNA